MNNGKIGTIDLTIVLSNKSCHIFPLAASAIMTSVLLGWPNYVLRLVLWNETFIKFKGKQLTQERPIFERRKKATSCVPRNIRSYICWYYVIVYVNALIIAARMKTKMRFFCVLFNQPLSAPKRKILSFVFMFRDFNTHTYLWKTGSSKMMIIASKAKRFRQTLDNCWSLKNHLTRRSASCDRVAKGSFLKHI